MSSPPPQGHMVLFDAVVPPLRADSYDLEISTTVTYDATPHELRATRRFDIDAPRFSMAPAEVASVHPPRNGHGPFQYSLPQIVLSRRTLPWERPLVGDEAALAPRDRGAAEPPAPADMPWMALLVFEEGEAELLQQVELEKVVPAEVFARLGAPAGIRCDAVEADRDLLREILPAHEEIALLVHARQVNVDDRELAAGDSDGWFAVVVANRLPSPGAKCLACLVSLEERTDLIFTELPPYTDEAAPLTVHPLGNMAPVISGVIDEVALESDPSLADPLDQLLGERLASEERLRRGDNPVGRVRRVPGLHDTFKTPGSVEHVRFPFQPRRNRLVVLHSWQFQCEGSGRFRELMQGLDVGLLGTTPAAGAPQTTDTGHLRIDLRDRAGQQQPTWYRGPLVPVPLARDALGPYHSADQARRAAPEAGAEDVSYAAAFEVGRQLAAADARLAQELMRWRRGAYRASVRDDLFGDLRARLPEVELMVERPELLLVPVIAQRTLEEIVGGCPAPADRFGLELVERAPGLDPVRLGAAWQIGEEVAAAALAGDRGVVTQILEAVAPVREGSATLESVGADRALLDDLGAAREALLARVERRGPR